MTTARVRRPPRIKRPICAICGRRIERDCTDSWVHLPTVAGIEAEKHHGAVCRGEV